MQQITLSGTLITEAFRQVDKKGRPYIRFTLSCGSIMPGDRVEYTHYKCVCYIGGYDRLEKGDQVFVVGKLQASIQYDESQSPSLNLQVMVTNMSGGRRAEDKKKK